LSVDSKESGIGIGFGDDAGIQLAGEGLAPPAGSRAGFARTRSVFYCSIIIRRRGDVNAVFLLILKILVKIPENLRLLSMKRFFIPNRKNKRRR
jgi:hypothetical protein